MEEKSSALTKKARVRDAVLLTLYGAGIVSLAVMAPNAARLLKYVDPNFAKKRRADHRIREAARRMENAGLLRRTSRGYELTRRGMRHAELVSATHEPKPRSWDRKWRIVMFDVWERRKITRNRLRAMLREKGFLKLQDSVWVYPYPCEEFIVLLRAELKLGGALIYVIAESIDTERSLMQKFDIPS